MTGATRQVGAPDGCIRCTLYRSRQCVVNSTLPDGAEVLVVGEAPGRVEEEQRKGFVGDAGEYLRNALREVGFDPRKIAYANACRCRPPLTPKKKQRTPTPAQIKECGVFLAEDIERLKPKLILALGRSALIAVHRAGGTMSECMGAPFLCDRFGIPTIVAYHPSAVMQGYQEARTFHVALERAKKFIDGDTENDLGEYLVIAPTDDYTEEDALRDLEWLRDDLLAGERFSFDFETDNVDTSVAKVFCASFSGREKEGYVVPLLGRYIECEGQTVEEVVEVLGDGGRTPRDIWSPTGLRRVKEILAEILTSEVDKVAQNGIYDIECARNDLGIEVRRYTFDIMLAHHLGIDERPPHDLETLRREFTTLPPYNIELKKWAPTKLHKFVAVPDGVLWDYSAADADCELRVATAVLDALRKEEHKYVQLGAHFEWLLHELAMPLQRTLSYSIERGIPINVELLAALAEALPKHRDRIAREMNDILTTLDITPPRNYDSWQQLARMMYNPAVPVYVCTCAKHFMDSDTLDAHLLDKFHDGHRRKHISKGLGLPRRAADSRATMEGKTREPTDSEAIDTMLHKRDVNGRSLRVDKKLRTLLESLLLYKYYGRMRGTFVGDEERTKGWGKHIRDDWEGRGLVHSHFHIPGTSTGRLSSSDPNVQNPPRDVVFRNCVRPPKGFLVIDVDYSQVENRIMAYGARCMRYLRDLLTCNTCHEVFEGRPREYEEHIKLDGHGRGDIHIKSAAHIYKIAEADVTKEQRNNAKRFVHATNYGVSAWTIARRYNLTLEDAQAQQDNYFEPYPELRDFQHKLIPRQLRKYEAVSNIFGRVRRFEGYNALRRYVDSEREKDKPTVFKVKNPKQARYFLGNMKREAISTFPQASSADILHLATSGLGDWRGVEEYGAQVLIHHLLKERLGDFPAAVFRHEFNAYIAISMHDSLVAIAPEKYAEQARDLMCAVMFETPLLAIPAHQAECGPHPIYGEWPDGWYLPVEASIRERWGTDQYPDGEALGKDELGVEHMSPPGSGLYGRKL